MENSNDVCNHEVMRKVMTGEYKGSFIFECCNVAHYFDDGTMKPPCVKCPECGKWLSYEERLKMLKAKDK